MSNIAFFLSSTFNDMQSERDLIREKITPELEKELKAYGTNIEFIDLRWGIDTKNITERDANKKILKTCFEEIKNTKPFFIAFIGERYGWIPNSEDVEEAYKDSALDIAEDYLERSITELEIICAQYSYNAMNRCLFYFREPVEYGLDISAQKQFVSGGIEKEKLIKLKRSLTEKYKNQVRTYTAVWNFEKQRIEGLEALEHCILDDIRKSVTMELSSVHIPENDIERSYNILLSTIERLSQSFSGRLDEISEMEGFLNDKNERILLVSGDSGCGKSSLLAKFITLQHKKNCVIVPFYAGIDEYSYSVENMMKFIVYQLSKMMGIDLCFDPKLDTCDIREVAKQFNVLLNQSSQKKQTILVIDALNQFSESIYEQNLKWLNLFALNPAVKIILSSTSDYYQMKHIHTLNTKIINLNYFTKIDIANVTKKYFEINRKEINPTLLDEILNKENKNSNPCSQPLYLMTLLQELNNLDAEDFKTIKNNEINSGDTTAEAISKYLNEIVKESPFDLFSQLDRLFEKVSKKIGSTICEVFVCAIAISRHGINERFIEKISINMGYEFSTTTFSYFRKLLKNHLCQRENGAWDFNHTLVKNFFSNKYNDKQLKTDVLHAILNCLLEVDDDLPFKCSEYCHYLALANELDVFVSYYSSMKNNNQVKQSFLSEMQRLNGDKVTEKLFFPFKKETFDIWIFFRDSLINQEFGSKASEKYAQNVLNSIYSTDYSLDLEKLDIISGVYLGLGITALQSGYYTIARDYFLMALKVLKKSKKAELEFEVYSKLATCYFYIGNEKKRRKYWRLAESSLKNDLEKNRIHSITELLKIYYNDCSQKTDEIIINKKQVKKILLNIQNLLQLNILSQEDNAVWCSRILYFSSFVGSYNDKDKLLTHCLNYISDNSNTFVKAEILYNLGVFYTGFDFKRAYKLLKEAHKVIVLILRQEESVEALKLFDKILETEKILFNIKKEKSDTISSEQLKCISMINLLAPDYNSLNRQIASLSVQKQNKVDGSDLKKMRNNFSRREVSAEHKVENKILISLIFSVVLFFLIMLPCSFVFFRSYITKLSMNHGHPSLYSFFMYFYFQAVFEAFFNLFICLFIYGLLQIFKLGNDFKIRYTWVKRCSVFGSLSVVIIVSYYLLWTYLEKKLIIEMSFRNWEINCLFLILSGLLLLVISCNELFTFVTREKLLYSRLKNYAHFVLDYRNKILTYLVNVVVLVMAIIMYWLASMAFIEKGYLNDFSGPILVLPIFWFKIASITIACIMLLKVSYLTSIRFIIGAKYGKDFKN